MINILRRIVEKINHAEDLNEVLNIIVGQVKTAISADVCSIYLQSEEDDERYVLMATEGLNKKAISKISLNAGHGLVGQVAERGDLLNLASAQLHPEFHLFNELGETDFHGFSALPIISHKKVLGVLVVQSKLSQEFSQDIVDFLLTITAQLSSAINHARALDSIPVVHLIDHPLRGAPVSPGVAIAKAKLNFSGQNLFNIPDRLIKDIETEKTFFLSSVEKVKNEIKQLSENLSSRLLPTEDLAIFDAYLLMLDSSSFIDKTIEHIHKGLWAPTALRLTIEEHISIFSEMENRYLKERVKDISDLGQSILDQLLGNTETNSIAEKSILVAEDFSAMDLSKVDPGKIKGIVSAKGSRTSHIAILARSLGIPTVMGVTEIPIRQLENCEVIVDGYSGKVYISPSVKIRTKYLQFEQQEIQFESSLSTLVNENAETTDGKKIPIFVNLGVEDGIMNSIKCGCDGVGLFRTEFPFMTSQQFPGEKKQSQIYKTVLENFYPQPVTLRTLDVGGDKALSYFPIEEENPFLGWRGIRISLDHPEIFSIQIRAMLKASLGLNNLQILLPMVSSLSEIAEARILVQKVYDELIQEGLQIEFPKLGVMIEVPSLIFQIHQFVDQIDFISIGTNDLVQYLLAVDRNNPSVASIYEPLHPAVISAINLIITEAHKHQVSVSVCGEMASDPLACVLLLGMKIDSLSVNLSSVGRIKWLIRHFSEQDSVNILTKVLTLSNPEEVRNYLEHSLENKGLSGLFKAGGELLEG